MEGPLCKWTNVMKGWQYRWFVLDDNAGLLSYYTSKEKMIKADRRGCVRLRRAVIGIDDEDDSTFTITVDGKMFHFQEERTKWVSSLEDTILRHTHRRRGRKNDQANNPVPTLSEYERKLTETDAYLQLIIEQLKTVDAQIEATKSEHDRERLVDIKAKTLTLLDSIKHAIVLLQIAKNTVAPVNGTHTESNRTTNQRILGVSSYVLTPKSATSSIGSDGCDIPDVIGGPGFSSLNPSRQFSTSANSRTSTDFSDHGLGDHRGSDEELSHHLRVSQPGLRPVPETSYSSSDDDYDDFEDALDDLRKPSSNNNNCTLTDSAVSANLDIAAVRKMTLDAVSVGKTPPVDSADYDAMYEDDEDDLGSLEGHGSVISHLISQVKIGMDLTKVVLPTFILERRSLLEMYADFFAHPDLFISITEPETPEGRFVNAVKWYVSAFHAGRRSSVAKKPYNPVIGEMFKCHWDVPGYQRPVVDARNASSNDNMHADGPVPWATSSNLTFTAEQVSHHPPISAFYAEHVEKRIMCSAHIYTKSKFLGLSIGVHNLGQGSVYLLDRGEEYVVTFPSAYGRSILTVPWVELGGSATVSCAQTGYSANIEFVTKPFYGGKKHRISGEILNPAKKTVLTITGEWNGVMHAKWADGRTELFVDTKILPVIKKKVQPIAKQDEFESRRLWKDVTLALKVQDVNLATSAKFSIEQKQRELVKERQEKEAKWDTREFHALGENWFYNTPLTKRQSNQTYKVGAPETRPTGLKSSKAGL